MGGDLDPDSDLEVFSMDACYYHIAPGTSDRPKSPGQNSLRHNLLLCCRTVRGSVRVRTPPRGSDNQNYGLMQVFKKIPTGFCPTVAKGGFTT